MQNARVTSLETYRSIFFDSLQATSAGRPRLANIDSRIRCERCISLKVRCPIRETRTPPGPFSSRRFDWSRRMISTAEGGFTRSIRAISDVLAGQPFRLNDSIAIRQSCSLILRESVVKAAELIRIALMSLGYTYLWFFFNQTLTALLYLR